MLGVKFFKKLYSGLVLGSVLGSCLVSQGASAADEVSESSNVAGDVEVASDSVVSAVGEVEGELGIAVGPEEKIESEKQHSGQDITAGSDGGTVDIVNTETADNAADSIVDLQDAGAVVNAEDAQSNGENLNIIDNVQLPIGEDDTNEDVEPDEVPVDDVPAAPAAGDVDDTPAAPVADYANDAPPAADGSIGRYLIAGIFGATVGNGMYIFIDKLLGKK